MQKFKYKLLYSFPLLLFFLFVSVFRNILFSTQRQNIADSPGSYYLVPVLLFHNLDGTGIYSFPREEFREYLEILKNEEFQVVSLEALYNHWRQNQTFQKPSVVITIDDNFVNVVRVLAPILREYNFPATFFFYTKDIFENPEHGTSWKDLLRLVEEGFSIQSHSYSHTVFHIKHFQESEEEYKKRLYVEFVVSKQQLEEKLQKPVWAFAYPMGFYTEELHSYAFSAGYRLLLTTDAKPVNLLEPFHGIIHRYTIQKLNNRKEELKHFHHILQIAKKRKE